MPSKRSEEHTSELFDKAKGRIVGSDQYLTKPFSKDELLGAIKAHAPSFIQLQEA